MSIGVRDGVKFKFKYIYRRFPRAVTSGNIMISGRYIRHFASMVGNDVIILLFGWTQLGCPTIMDCSLVKLRFQMLVVSNMLLHDSIS